LEPLFALRDPVNERLEALRGEKKIGKSVEAALDLGVPADSPLRKALENHADQLAELFIVSTVRVHNDDSADPVSITVSVADGDRCPRCWRTVTEMTGTPLGTVCPRCADALQPHLSHD
jgi:isoleucyl-tRNA synthetase